MLAAKTILRGRYEILFDLPGGGMSVVYKALDTRTGEHRAVKELDAQVHAGPTRMSVADLTARFDTEVKIHGALRHPAIPRFHEHFALGGCLYLIMDWLEGETLEDWFIAQNQQGITISEQRCCEIGSAIAAVLEYMHGRTNPLVFRDLKPPNVMVLPDDSIRVIDLGIAKELFGGVTQNLTASTRAIGSPGYAPKEQCQGHPKPASDVYALGCVMHELLSAQSPLHLVIPDPIQAQRPDVSNELARLLADALQDDWHHRPTAAEMRQRIDSILTRFQPAPPQPSATAQLVNQLSSLLAQGLAVAHQALQGVQLPKLAMPNVTLPKVTLPKPTLPRLQLPAMRFPQMQLRLPSISRLSGRRHRVPPAPAPAALPPAAVPAPAAVATAAPLTRPVTGPVAAPIRTGVVVVVAPDPHDPGTYVDPSYTWHDPSWAARATVMHTALLTNPTPQLRDRIESEFWQLVLTNELRATGFVTVRCTDLAGNHEPSGFRHFDAAPPAPPPQPRGWWASLMRWWNTLIGVAPPALTPAPYYLDPRLISPAADQARTLLENHPLFVLIDTLGLTQYSLEDLSVCTVYYRVDGVWYSIQA